MNASHPANPFYSSILPVGKLPHQLLQRLLGKAPIFDKRVLFGPGLGRDCAVVDAGKNLLVFKTDPITFADDQIGWYAVQVSVNDIATMGALPRWYMATLLLPEGKTNLALVEQIFEQIFAACREMEISLVGGHTEITHGIDRPILVGTMIGEVAHHELVTPQGIQPGDHILLTKGVPIEGTAILARQVPGRLLPIIGEDGLLEAANFLFHPGISVLKDAQIAVHAGHVSGMHDPTEGGLITALWEMAQVCGMQLLVNLQLVPIPAISMKICQALKLDALRTISSGSLLIAVSASDAASIIRALEEHGINCTDIGRLEKGNAGVINIAGGRDEQVLPATRDEICKIFET